VHSCVQLAYVGASYRVSSLNRNLLIGSTNTDMWYKLTMDHVTSRVVTGVVRIHRTLSDIFDTL
jgi:hypothetical protein